MQLDFLCFHHRRALQRDPDAAARLWAASMEAVDAVPREPTPWDVKLAGAGLEAAGLYLLARRRCPRELVERYITSALYLIALLAELRQTRLGILVLALANGLVAQLIASGRAPLTAAGSRQRLDREAARLLERAGLLCTPRQPATEALQ